VTTVRQALETTRRTEDARLILAHVLKRDPTWLYAHPEHPLEVTQLERFHALLERRAAGEPLAYLTGEKEFWSLPLKVTPATLIPPPEPPLLVELAMATPSPPRSSGAPATPSPSGQTTFQLLDLGTGSGAIALALAHERPAWAITATDVSTGALEVARQNARRLALANVRFRHGHWYQPLATDERFHLILSNPPYVAEGDSHLLENGLPHEPARALAAGPEGLDDLRAIIAGAPGHLHPGGWLLVEHGMEQGEAVRALFRQAGFGEVATRQDLAGRDRVTLGCYSGF
jgi:release factor glutamine methyltransferase